MWDARAEKKVRRNFSTESEARAWRADTTTKANRGTLVSSTPTTVRQAARLLTDGMRTGVVRTRTGDPYKPSVIRGYEQALALYVLDDLGGLRLSDVRRRDVQHLADRLLARGLSASTIRNALMPLRVLYRRAVEDGDVAATPLANLRLPAVRGRRDRVAAPDEAARLLRAIPGLRERAVYSTAIYAGLRVGELRALRWQDVDLAAGVVRVEHALDAKGETIPPKSRAGRRGVPIAARLRDVLLAWRVESPGDGYAFGDTATRPFSYSTVRARARKAWKDAELAAIGLHECRHTCASLMIAAGVNAKALSAYLGHESIETTFNLYGHLMPGNETEAAALLDAYLDRADSASRIRQLDA